MLPFNEWQEIKNLYKDKNLKQLLNDQTALENSILNLLENNITDVDSPTEIKDLVYGRECLKEVNRLIMVRERKRLNSVKQLKLF